MPEPYKFSPETNALLSGTIGDVMKKNNCLQIKKYIDDEEQAVKDYEQLSKELGLPSSRIIDGIRRDEQRHHDSLKRIFENECAGKV